MTSPEVSDVLQLAHETLVPHPVKQELYVTSILFVSMVVFHLSLALYGHTDDWSDQRNQSMCVGLWHDAHILQWIPLCRWGWDVSVGVSLEDGSTAPCRLHQGQQAQVVPQFGGPGLGDLSWRDLGSFLLMCTCSICSQPMSLMSSMNIQWTFVPVPSEEVEVSTFYSYDVICTGDTFSKGLHTVCMLCVGAPAAYGVPVTLHSATGFHRVRTLLGGLGLLILR